MNKRIKLLFICCLLFVICSSLPALDLGLTLFQNAGFSDSGFRYSANLVPHVSGLIGENSDYYASAGLELGFKDGLSVTPELLRTELTYRSSALAVKAGRMYQSDPLGLIASGLFDGARVSYDSSLGSFYVGAWYTGLLYKKRVNIEMTLNDSADAYFAPKRMIAGLGWEHLSFSGVLSASAALLGQFDLSGGKALHSQYLAGKFTVPVNAFSSDLGGYFDFIQLGGCFELLQQSGEFGTGFAAELGVGFLPPIPPIQSISRLSLLARYASGGNAFAFLPITTIGQGNILGAKLSGITMISLDYTAQLNNTLSAGINSSYFIRNDKKTFNAYPLGGGSSGSGDLLGNEFFAKLLWSPYSDIYANLGMGIFLPSMGNAAPNENSKWRVELNVILLLY
jgi:hypothetical protein